MQNENQAKVDDWDCKSSPPVINTPKRTFFGAGNLVASALVALLVLAGTSNAKAVCLAVPGDLNGNGSANVVDVQCAILVSLWALDGMVAPQPECLVGDVSNGDTNCDGQTNVVDVQITIQYSLSQPLSAEIDANQNKCPDSCELETCGNGTCAADGSETCVSCPGDCGPCTGACCEPNDSIGCEDAAITACVCAADAFCCEVAWDSTCATEVESLGCGDCPAPPGDCCVAGEGAGCTNAACEACVCAADPFCCDVQWDDLCAGAAASNCQGDCACPIPAGCCEAHDAPGCDNDACEACVCALDPFCCDTAWDGICVGEAQVDCAADCSCPVTSDCCTTPGDVPGCGPGNTACEDCVCALDPFCCDTAFDQLCVDAANGPDCGAACGCVASNPCLDFGVSQACCDTICAVDPFCCETAFDSICQDELALCGNSTCCETGSDAPGCGDPACEACVCAVDPFCCDTAWDGICVGEANDPALCGADCNCVGEICGNGTCGTGEDCANCPDDCGPCTNPCIDFGVDPACCDTICAVDPFCCETAFDSICEGELSLCDAPNPCLDFGVSQACCDTICAVDPFCCETAFDLTCEGELSLCEGTGNPICCETGDGDPGCGDANCEACVCGLDPFCCDTAWDGICVSEAQNECQTECGCAAPPVVSDCCTTVGEVGGCGPGNLACEDCVCALDPFCCDTAFDQLCVDAANGPDCGIACGCIEVQSDCCTTTSGLTGCTDPTCEACVCALDPFCCETSWDGICVNEAQNDCAADCNCPAISDCCTTVGDVPGCGPGNIACEDCVCALDPFCCDTAFDQLCVDAANGPDCGAACGCIATPCIDFGVDPACCDTICAVDPFCCETSFDSICQGELSLCDAPNPCLDFGVSQACCDTICAVDPFCCETAFDLTCEGELSLCEGTGNPVCCETGDGDPGCGDANCEACVCALDPFCCDTAWDGICVGEAQAQCQVECGCGT
ncbi:MAG: hypothetical protein HUU55_15710, partial [Myxococcales bacterium]|nr:hypothetical protein [Myxococcales bacterium]